MTPPSGAARATHYHLLSRALHSLVLCASALVLQLPAVATASLSLEDMAGRQTESTNRGVAVSFPVTEYDLTAAEFSTQQSYYEGLGFDLLDVEIVYRSGAERYSATWAFTPGTVHAAIQVGSTDWSSFLSTVGALNGRFLDIEVDYYGGTKRWSGLFYEDGDDYSNAIRTTNTDSGFQDYLHQYFTDGYSIIDFEAYATPSSGMRYAGAWVRDPNQPPTVLYYNLESTQLSSLFDLDDGYVIDYERYYHSGHGEYRWAVILEPQTGGEQHTIAGATEATMTTLNNQNTDSDTFLIDIEPREDGATAKWEAVWGNNFKSLYETAAIPADTNVQPGGTAIQRADNFEALGSGSRMGIWAKNLRTGQTIVKRASEPFYIASTAKIAIHIRLWQMFQAFAAGQGGIDPTTSPLYTNCADCRHSWYVDERLAGFSSADFGMSFALTVFDQFMMQTSDNAAASMLVDHSSLGLKNQPQNLNQWLAGIDGVSQEFFPVTSIQEVDRTILWQGQVEAFPDDAQYHSIPAWAFEPFFRSSSSSLTRDRWCDLAIHLAIECNETGYPDYPGYNSDEGHERYYNMGLNSASPRAVGRLLEKLAEEDFLDAATTRAAINVMTEPGPFDNQLEPAIARATDIWRKGGVKGGESQPISDAGIFEVGNDDLIVVVLTKDNDDWQPGATANVRSYTAAIANDLVKQLTANLTSENSASFAPTVYEGQQFKIETTIENEGGGDSEPFKVRFYVSLDSFVNSADTFLGEVSVGGIDGYGSTVVTHQAAFPSGLTLRDYWVGWIIDDASEASEWNEDAGDQRHVNSSAKVTVVEPPLFADGFESGTTSAWSP